LRYLAVEGRCRAGLADVVPGYAHWRLAAVVADGFSPKLVNVLEETQADQTDDSLHIYAVNVMGGYGVYLGNGLVLTATHLMGPIWTEPTVRVGGLVLSASVVKETAFQSLDLTLLRIDQRQLPIGVQLHRMTVCQNPPWVGAVTSASFSSDAA
jgi:uncharacterized membrane protein